MLPKETYITASYILQNSDLLKLDSVIDAKLFVVNNSVQLIIYYKFKSKYQLYRVRNLIKDEPYFLNKGVKDGLFYIRFKAPDKYANMLQYIRYTDLPIHKERFDRCLSFWQKEIPATRESSRD